MNLLNRLARDKEQMHTYISRSAKVLAILGCTLIPVMYFVDQVAVSDSNYDTLLVRLIGGIVCLPFFFEKQDTTTSIKHWENYCFWVLIPMFPFVWGVMLLGNAASSDPGAPADMLYWGLQYLVALFMFTQLANSPYVATTQYLFATACAAVFVYFTVDSINWHELIRVFGWPFGIYLTAVVLGSITNRNPAMVRHESLSAARAVGSNIAHEMRTPLTGIASRAKASTRHLPILVEAYRTAKDAGLPVEPLTERQLELLGSSFEDIEKEARYSNLMINMLLVNTSENPVFGQSIETVSASELVDEALQRYPFANDRERNLVHQDTKTDFEASVPKLLIDHVIFNLVKNALYYVQHHGSGSITVTIDLDPSGKSAGIISVYDDGPGIPASDIERIFDRFFTTTAAGRGSGIGLNFCKMVMEGLGGSIRCDSVYGEYSMFSLHVPKVPRPEFEANSMPN